MKKITDLQLDILREMNNIGVGHAAIALSQLIDKKIMVAVTKTQVIPSDVFLKEMVGDPDALVATVYLEMLGDVRGAVVFMFRKESALKLCDLLLSKELGTTKFIDEKCQSAIKEVGSILTGAFLGILADMINLKVFHKVPYFAFDTAEDVINGVMDQVFSDTTQRTCLATEFIESSNQITGAFAFIPSKEAMEKILTNLGEHR